MIADRLRKAVLQAAMEGKLTKQLDNDSSVYQLITEVHKIDNDDLWEIPNNWIWTTLDDVTIKISSGGTPSRSNPYYWQNGTIPWLKIKDIKSKYINKSEEFITELGLINSSAKIFPKGTILYTIFATVGDCGILNFDSATNQAIAGITLIDDLINNEYAYYVLLASKNRMLLNARGMAQLNINQQILKNLEIPLPPIEEQKRIVEKLEVLLAEINKLEEDEKALKDLEDKFPEKLKESILQNAFEGKFTESLETDSNVDDFIDELKSKQKIKSTEYIIETPFNIPSSWRWEKVGNIFYKIFSHRTPKYSNIRNENFILGQRNNQDYGLDLENIKYGTSEYWESIKEDMFLEKNDVLLNTLGGGTVGRSGIFNLKGKYITDGHLFIFRSGNDYLQKYFLYYLQLKRKEIEKGASGSTNQIFLRLKDVKEYLIPIPPYDELKRIVDKLDNLFALYF